jgi:hypothetical protein
MSAPPLTRDLPQTCAAVWDSRAARASRPCVLVGSTTRGRAVPNHLCISKCCRGPAIPAIDSLSGSFASESLASESERSASRSTQSIDTQMCDMTFRAGGELNPVH